MCNLTEIGIAFLKMDGDDKAHLQNVASTRANNVMPIIEYAWFFLNFQLFRLLVRRHWFLISHLQPRPKIEKKERKVTTIKSLRCKEDYELHFWMKMQIKGRRSSFLVSYSKRIIVAFLRLHDVIVSLVGSGGSGVAVMIIRAVNWVVWLGLLWR